MKRSFALIPAAAAAAFFALSPASAQWGADRYDNTYNANGHQTQRSHDRSWTRQRGWNGQQQQGWNGGWNSRSVSADPSLGNRSGINAARRTGRCVEDLGYGRFEYCGW